jgi:Trypsin-like peptidase domain/Colicin V production protein
VTALDWIIIAFTVLMATWGYAQGLIVGALSLAGFAGGAFLGSRLGPLLLEEGSRSPYAALSALVGALVVGAVLAAFAEVLGFHLRRRLGDRLGVLDGMGGALLVGCLGLFLVWVGGAVALHTPGATELREPIQRSKILSELNSTLPPSGPLIQALARFDPFPEIAGPDADVRPPNSRIARDPQVKRAGGSVVRVLGTACGLGVQGSGWVARDGVVVTNAHVVAGQDDTTVQAAGEGERLPAQAIWFDPKNDLAVLRAPGLSGVPALPRRVAGRVGAAAAILGFPGNGDYEVQPGRLGQTETVVSQDAYGRGPVERNITSVRGLVRSGNSGGPVIDGAGRVLTTIFATSVSNPGETGFGVPASIVEDALKSANAPVGTGPCTS